MSQGNLPAPASPPRLAKTHPAWKTKTRILAQALRVAAGRVTKLPPRRARRFLDVLGRFAPGNRSIERQTTLVGGVPCQWYRPKEQLSNRVCVFFHGGGYALCSNSTHRMMMSDLALASGARFLGVDYRLAPEHPFPAGLDDCVAVVRGLLDEGSDPAEIVVCGDSAGGTLALSTLIRLRDEHCPLPGGLILLSPWPDLECQGSTMADNAPFDYVSKTVMRFFADIYLQGEDARSALVSPIHADLTGLPPTLIHAGGAEILLADIRKLAARLEQCGVEVELEVWDGMVHAWHGFTLFIPEARDAIASVGAFVRNG